MLTLIFRLLHCGELTLVSRTTQSPTFLPVFPPPPRSGEPGEISEEIPSLNVYFHKGDSRNRYLARSFGIYSEAMFRRWNFYVSKEPERKVTLKYTQHKFQTRFLTGQKTFDEETSWLGKFNVFRLDSYCLKTVLKETRGSTL